MQDQQDLVAHVRANFVRQKTSLNRFCLNNGIDPSNAVKALSGKWSGEKATEIRELIISSSEVVSSEAITYASGE